MAQLLFDLSNYTGAQLIIDEILAENPDNISSLRLRGRIHIEYREYDSAQECFLKVCQLAVGDTSSILWFAYAKYINLHFSFKDNSLSFREGLLQLIGELERTQANIKKCDHNSYRNKSMVLYLLGYFYFRCGDVITAKNRLIQSLKYYKNNEARELLHSIWNYKIKPSFWQWWLKAPNPLSGIWKRIIFGLLCGIALLVIIDVILIANRIYSVPRIATQQEIIILILLGLVILAPNLLHLRAADVEVHLSQPPETDSMLVHPAIEGKLISMYPLYSISTKNAVIEELATSDQFNFKMYDLASFEWER